MKESTSKEKILKKIKTALLEKHNNPYPNLEDSPLYLNYSGQLDVLFADELHAVSGVFAFCEKEIQLVENLLNLAEKKKWHKIYAWEPKLQSLLKKYEFPSYSTETDFLNADVGITFCESLIARNGSVLVSNGSEAGRRLSIYPHIHIVIAYKSQLVLDLKDGFQNLKKKYPEALPSMVSIITGPSRTADIEKTLVLGAHGPKELYVFLLEG